MDMTFLMNFSLATLYTFETIAMACSLLGGQDRSFDQL